MLSLRSRLKALQLGLFLLAFQCFADSENKPPIHWLMVDWPPYTYTDQDDQWRGYGANFLFKIIEHLPEYKHYFLKSKFSYLNSSKFVRERNICSIGIYPTQQREEILTFSLPDQIFPPMQLWMRKDTYSSLGRPDYLSLDALMDSRLGVLGLKAGVAYSPELRTVISRYEHTKNVLRLTQSEMTIPLAGMLHLGRIDFMLEYADMMHYTLASEELRHLKGIVPVSVEEERGILHYTRVGCPKTPVGAKIIETINAVLPSLYADESYWAPFMQYLTPQQKIEFDRYLNRLIENPADWRYIAP
ncbi:hypothetical protein [Hahella ganghwensis]|uniref:hypothetical protein n=1 Tax=Hahella ganghwensis TaxID=286420 RepID=UPI00037CE972|nr:hypothetical protein [Hahella ganghwensis]